MIPHSDGSDTIDAVGPGVSDTRVGQRVWVYNAQSYRPFGTAARYTVVPDQHAPQGVDRISEVAFSDDIDLDAAVVRNGAVIAAYATRAERPDFPFWPLLFDNVTIRLFGSDDFPSRPSAKPPKICPSRPLPVN